MTQGPSVLLLDDGELDDIQALLEEVGVPFARVRGGAIVDGTPPPSELLISTPRRIEAVRRIGRGSDGTKPLRLVVVAEDSNTLRDQLRRDGFDYLVRRPVHPEALRLMLLRCLYRGEERRREPRVAVGFEVSFRTGLRTRRAVLADLSVRGCRLVSSAPIDSGRRIRVSVPEALETGDPVSITGHVLRVDRPKESDRAHLYNAAVLFDEMRGDAREVLELLIEDLAIGPATLRRGITPSQGSEALPENAPPHTEPPRAPTAGAATATAEDDDAIEVNLQVDPPRSDPGLGDLPGDRRGLRRVTYANTVPAFGKRALRVLVGRDLSISGMRIEPMAGLDLGDRLHLAIYGDPGESPFLVWATVRRDDGPAGIALAFDELDETLGQRLECLVGSLPSVESLHDTEAQAMGTVVSEILEE